MRFQVLTAASMMFRVVFWVILPLKRRSTIILYGSISHCLHHQGWRQYAPLKRRSTIILHGSISHCLHHQGGSTHLWNVGRQSFYTAVYPRRQLWTSLPYMHATRAAPSGTREVSGSSLGPETGYPDWGLSWFSSVPPGKHRDSKQATTASFHTLSNSSFTFDASHNY
jgi:hypothetical protein